MVPGDPQPQIKITMNIPVKSTPLMCCCDADLPKAKGLLSETYGTVQSGPPPYASLDHVPE
jgi:hypothetical protein